MLMPKRIAMLAVTAAVALVPAVAADASVPRNPQPMPLKPCVVKWILAPTTNTTQTSSMPSIQDFDVENQYAAGESEDDDSTVAHDDLTYDGC
jgi:opacity protein-like surface antigen